MHLRKRSALAKVGGMPLHSRVLFAQSMFFDISACSRLNELHGVRIRMRGADGGCLNEMDANYFEKIDYRLGAHDRIFVEKCASASSKCDFGGPAGSSRTLTSAFAPAN